MKQIFLLLLIPCFSFSQTIESDKVDDFTGARTVKTNQERLDGFNLTVMGAYMKIKGDSTFCLWLGTIANTTTAVQSGSKTLLKLDNDEIITLVNVGDYDIVSKGDVVGCMAFLSGSDMENLMKHKVVKVRFETSKENIDVAVPEKSLDKIPAIVKLIKDKSIEKSK